MDKNSYKIAVFGSSKANQGSRWYEEARILCAEIAAMGWTVVNGGYSGIMEASSRGAKESGGKTIGITTSFSPSVPNSYTDNEIRVDTYAARITELMTMPDGYVIFHGGSGTLAELFLSWELVKNGSVPPKPIVLYGAFWERIFAVLKHELSCELSFSSYINILNFTEEPAEAIALLKSGIESNGRLK